MTEMDSKNTEKIRQLNDDFRKSFFGGRIMITQGIQALDQNTQAIIVAVVKGFNSFTEDNDPHKEHDFGSFVVTKGGGGSVKIFWKIDYYDKKMEFGSEDPSDVAQTTRVLTIMLADEY